GVLGKCTKASQRKGKGDSPGILSPRSQGTAGIATSISFAIRKLTKSDRYNICHDSTGAGEE
ncbi:unnamed protein product, partial [marine sediment metagenome]